MALMGTSLWAKCARIDKKIASLWPKCVFYVYPVSLLAPRSLLLAMSISWTWGLALALNGGHLSGPSVPGYTKTPMNKKSLLNKKDFEYRASKTMLGRWGDTKEFVGPVLFLASDMSSYVTGSDLVVDGGWLGKGF